MSARWDPPTRSPLPPYPIDPYVEWAQLTRWRGYARASRFGDDEPGARGEPATPPRRVTILAEAPDGRWLKGVDARGSPDSAPWLQVPPVYGKPLPGTSHVSRFFTAELSGRDFEERLLAGTSGLVRWRLAMPRRQATDPMAASSKGLFGRDSDAKLRPPPNPFENQPPAPKRGSLPGAIAVIDYGCPFANLAFADGSGGSRVAALWNQGAARLRKPWQPCAALGHGLELGKAGLDLAIDQARMSGQDEPALYRSLDYLLDYADPRRRVWYGTHGGHVLHMAAGRPDPLGRPDTAAARARLVFVQLPLPTAMDSAGTSLTACLLDGVRYAMNLCQPGRPLVVNISYGGQAGPHDGTALFDQAIDDLMQHNAGNLAVVVAAGNARQGRVHARRAVTGQHSALLRLALSAGDTTDTFVECWYSPPQKGRIVCRVRSPQTLWSRWVTVDDRCMLRSDTLPDEPVGLLVHNSRVPNGDRHQVLLALTPTAQPPGLPCGLAPAGEWQIEFALERGDADSEPVWLDAWIERDDPAPQSDALRPFFIDQTCDDDLDTLSSIANGRFTIAVGGFNRETGDEAPYSARGAVGSGLPQVRAASEQDAESRSIQACATRSTEMLRLNGTSVAAPALARRLYDALAAEPGRRRTGAAVIALARQLAEDDPEGVLQPGPA